MKSIALSHAQCRRIEKLAHLAGRTPRSMLRFVLRDGLEATERDVHETIAADKDVDSNGGVPHARVTGNAIRILRWYRGKQNMPR